MNVLMISPGYPKEMCYFTRGLAASGARVFGLGDQPRSVLPEEIQGSIAAHLQVADLWDEGAVVRQVLQEVRRTGVRFHRVECLWEPAVILAARLREALDVPGMRVHEAIAFRDKERMKQVLDAAGIRTPWHKRARTQHEVREAAAQAGFPIIVKPIAGAGATHTYRIYDAEELEAVLPALRGVDEVSVEEYVEGDELTFDTICSDGRILFENISWYTTRPIEEKKHEWISPGCVCLRDLDAPEVQAGRRMGYAVLEAMGFQTGFTHMEWYRRPGGEVVFGEIGARPPGAHMVETMNYVTGADLYRGWAEAVCHGRFSQPLERRYNSAIICKRALGRGRIRKVEGLDRLVADLGDHIGKVEILPLGTPRRDWQNSAVSDGFVIVRHPDLDATLHMAARVGRELRILAG